MRGLRLGDAQERDLTGFDWTLPKDISADGNTGLFGEEGFGGGPNYSFFLRKMDGSPPVRLGDGNGEALSPDGTCKTFDAAADGFGRSDTREALRRFFEMPGSDGKIGKLAAFDKARPENQPDAE